MDFVDKLFDDSLGVVGEEEESLMSIPLAKRQALDTSQADTKNVGEGAGPDLEAGEISVQAASLDDNDMTVEIDSRKDSDKSSAATATTQKATAGDELEVPATQEGMLVPHLTQNDMREEDSVTPQPILEEVSADERDMMTAQLEAERGRVRDDSGTPEVETMKASSVEPPAEVPVTLGEEEKESEEVEVSVAEEPTEHKEEKETETAEAAVTDLSTEREGESQVPVMELGVDEGGEEVETVETAAAIEPVDDEEAEKADPLVPLTEDAAKEDKRNVMENGITNTDRKPDDREEQESSQELNEDKTRDSRLWEDDFKQERSFPSPEFQLNHRTTQAPENQVHATPQQSAAVAQSVVGQGIWGTLSRLPQWRTQFSRRCLVLMLGTVGFLSFVFVILGTNLLFDSEAKTPAEAV